MDLTYYQQRIIELTEQNNDIYVKGNTTITELTGDPIL